MSLWRQLRHGTRRLLRRDAAHRELSEEVRHYLEEAAAEHRARGMSPDAARRAARLELGGVESVTEQVRDYGWEGVVEALFADLRYAARWLVAEPVFTAVTVLTVAVGIGATAAIFSAVDAILLKPLPFPGADRIVTVWDLDADGARIEQTFGTFRELAARSRSFEQLAVAKPWQPTLTGAATPERLSGQRVSAGYFRVLGVQPALGRDFREADDRGGGPHEVILSDALWRRHFAADPEILGRPITLDGRDGAVIGVMPPGFDNVPAPPAELWGALQYEVSEGRAWGHHLRTLGRLRPGVGVEAARRELGRIAETPVAEFPRRPWASLEQGVVVSSLQDDVTAGVRPALFALLGAAGLLAAIAGVNVTNLLLARGARRRGELALRAALGASRGRLVRQLLTESLVLAAAGGTAGMGVALLGVQALTALAPSDLPRIDTVAVDGPVFACGLALTTLIGVAFGLVPALQAARSDPRRSLGAAASRTATARSGARATLVVAEVALAVVLLVGSGLLLRSLRQLLAVDKGFDASRLLTLQVHVSGDRFDDRTTERFYTQALAAVRALPGIEAAAFTSQLPLSGDLDLYGVRFDIEPAEEADAGGGAFRYAVSPGYTAALGIPLRRGRRLLERDGATDPRVALVSESLAERRLRGVDPIGRRIYVGPDGSPPFTIVGVVGDVRQQSLALTEAEAVYTPAAQWHFADRARSLVVRAAGGPAAGDLSGLVGAIRRAIWSVDAERPVVRVATMGELVDASLAERRFASVLFEAFAVASLLLAAAGIYGLLAGGVAERSREIGVRSALGATREGIVTLVVRQGLKLTALGALLGLAASVVATRALATMLFGVSRLDPATYLGVLAVVATVAVLACGMPASRAARVDPVAVLRAE